MSTQTSQSLPPASYGLALFFDNIIKRFIHGFTLPHSHEILRRLSEFYVQHKDQVSALYHGLPRAQSEPTYRHKFDSTCPCGFVLRTWQRNTLDTIGRLSIVDKRKPVLDGSIIFAEPESMLYSDGENSSHKTLVDVGPDILYSSTDTRGPRLCVRCQMVLLERVLADPDARKRVLALRGDEAQEFLDIGDWFLTNGCDGSFLGVQDDRWAQLRSILRRLIVRLIQLTSLAPRAILIRDISMDLDQDNMVSRLGSGSYADVYAGRLRRTNTIGVAVKVFRPLNDFDGEIRSENHLVQVFLREVAIQRYLDHPNICSPLGVLAEPAPHSPLCIVFPRMMEGNITQYVRSHPAIKQRDKYAMYLGLASALAYIHSENVVHGDIHGGNVLVQNGVPQLTDFGVANFADSTQASVSLTRTGASRWMAPEILEAEQEDGPVQPTPASDVFSFGMLMLQIHTAAPPFSALPPGRIKYKIINGQRPPRPAAMADALWQILQDCWRHKAEDRPTAENLVTRLGALADSSDAAA